MTDINQTEQALEESLPSIDTDVVCRLLKKSPHTRTETDIEILSQQLRKIKFFEKFSNESEFDVLKECCKQLSLETFKGHEKVFEIGSYGEKFYIIIQGKVGVNIRLTKQDSELKTVKVLKSGDSFGEIALIYKRPRLATIQCIDNCIFGVLSQKHYQNTLQSRELTKMLKEMQIFYNMALFNSWTQNKLRDLYLNSMWLNYKKGDLVYDLGDPAESMFVIQEGEFVVYTNSNFEKVVGNEEQSEDFNQFKRKIKSKDSSKTQQYLKVRILCQGEYFGEEEILNEQPRQYKIICNSFEGKALMIKKAHFLNHVFQDEISKQYIMNRLKEKTSKIEERIQNMKNSLKDYKQFLYQDRTLAKQQIVTKGRTQAQIKFDVFDTHEIIDKLMGSKQLKNTSQDKIPPSFRGQSTSPLKAQRTLPALQSMASFTNFDSNEPTSPTKSQSSLQKQNTSAFGDQFPSSPTSSKQKLRFSVTQQFVNPSPIKISDTISSSNRNYEMYVIESPERIQLNPSKNQNKLMKQLNLLNLNSPDNKIQFTNHSLRGIQSLTDMTEERQNKLQEILPNKSQYQVQSLIIQDEDLQTQSNQNLSNLVQSNYNAQQAQSSVQQTSRTNTSIAQHLQVYENKASTQNILVKIEENNEQEVKDKNAKQRSTSQLIGDQQRNSQLHSDGSYSKQYSELTSATNTTTHKSNPLQNLQFLTLKDQVNSPQLQRRLSNTSSPIKRSILISPSNNLQPIQSNGSIERIKLKLQLKSGYTSVDATPLQNSPQKQPLNGQQKATAHSTPGGILKPQSTCQSFSMFTDQNQQHNNLLQQKQQSFFSRKSLGSQFNHKPISGESAFNLFSVLDQEDQNLLQRQIQQKRNHQQDLITLKNHQKTYLRQWRQKSTNRNTQASPNKQCQSLNQYSNKDISTDLSRLDDQTEHTAQQTQNNSPVNKLDNFNKSTKNFSQLLESNKNRINSMDDDFSPYLKKKIKNIVKTKKPTDSALINFGNEAKAQWMTKNPIIAKPLIEINKDEVKEKSEEKVLSSQVPTLSLLGSSQEKRRKEQQSNDSNIFGRTSLIGNKKLSVNGEFLKQNQDFIKNLTVFSGEQKSKPRVSFQKCSVTSSSNEIRKTSIDGNYSKQYQQNHILQMQTPSATNESFTESLAFQTMPENKKKIFLNIMNKAQVQQYFQKQLKMFNKASQMQTHLTQQAVDDTQTVPTINLSQPISIEDKKRKTIYTSADSLAKKQIMKSETEPVNKINQFKTLAFQFETASPKKTTQNTDRNQMAGQFPSFSTSYAYTTSQLKTSDNFFQANSMKISQSPPSPKYQRISSQPTTLQYIN